MNIFFEVFFFFLFLITFFSLWFLRYCNLLLKYKNKDHGIKQDPFYQPMVSIIIPVYNEELMIGNKINNTFELEYPEEKREIIVVDSASIDNTVKIVNNFKNITLLTQPERMGKSHALSLAFKYAKGDLVLITDADAMLNQDVLEKIVPLFADPSIGAATGKLSLVGKDSTSKISEQAYRTFFDTLRFYESSIASTMIFNGPLMVFRSSIIEAPPINSVADDTEMALQVIKKGYRAIYIPEATFFERVPSRNSIRLKQKERRAQGLIQSFIKHRNMLFADNYGLFGKMIFPAEFIIHVLFPFLIIFTFFCMIPSFYYKPVQTLLIMAIAIIIIFSYAIGVYRKFGLESNDGTKSNFISIMITIFSFIQLQLALFKGAVKLFLFGSSHKWEQIKEVRVEEVKDK
jgi:cellulose synthase/poly-beta-1,6-N-acetylglucosamine synthase-like glycosyltransferase